MKKLGLSLFTVIALSLFLVSWNRSTNFDRAVHIDPISCGMLDGDGNFVLTDGSAVITSSGNGNLKCQAKFEGNATGSSVHYNFDNTGLLCGTPLGFTDQWNETVSASGNITLQCKYRP